MNINDFLNLSLKEIESLEVFKVEFSKRKDINVIKKGAPMFPIVSDTKSISRLDGINMIHWAFYANHESGFYRMFFVIDFISDTMSISKLEILFFGPLSFSDNEIDKDKSIRYYIEEARKVEDERRRVSYAKDI